MVYRWWTVGGPTLCASWVPGSAVGLATDCSLGPGEFLVIVLKDRINAYDVFLGFFLYFADCCWQKLQACIKPGHCRFIIYSSCTCIT